MTNRVAAHRELTAGTWPPYRAGRSQRPAQTTAAWFG